MSMLTVSQEGRIDFPSRISARAVAAGATVAMVGFSMLLALGGGFGLLPAESMTDARVLRGAGTGLIIWGALSWIAAAFAGAFVAALSARSASNRDGLLNGVTTWAAACLTAGVLTCVWFMSAISTGLASAEVAAVLTSKTAFASYFVADTLALGAALVGGYLGARYETQQPRRLLAVQPEERAQAIPPRSATQQM